MYTFTRSFEIHEQMMWKSHWETNSWFLDTWSPSFCCSNPGHCLSMFLKMLHTHAHTQ